MQTKDTTRDPFFQRYTRSDENVLARDIEKLRIDLAKARFDGDPTKALGLSADLGMHLTIARQEREAVHLLETALREARVLQQRENIGWLALYLATAYQYRCQTAKAVPYFDEALLIARSVGAKELEHYTLHHRARFRVESAQFANARQDFEEALVIRQALGDKEREASTRRALAALTELESNHPQKFALGCQR